MPNRQLTIWHYILLIGLMLTTIGLHRIAFGERNYREDEINTVHAAKIMSPSEITVWMATNIHPPAWRLFADSWIDAFGDDESVVRWSSVFANFLTLALLFRLGTDLLDWKMGVYALMLLGLYPIVASYMNELRPYPYLILFVTGLHLFFWRWIRTRQFRYMLLYIIFGILALYTHYYAIYIFPVHFIFMLLVVRWHPTFYFKTISMWFFIGLSFLGWIIPFIHGFTVRQSGGIFYALPNRIEGLSLLYERLRFEPHDLGLFLLLIGLSTPLFFNIRRESAYQQRWARYRAMFYPALLLILTVLLAWGANTLIRNVTARNMTIVIPTVVLLMALGLRSLPKPAPIIIGAILFLGTPQTLPSPVSNGPYREIVASMSETYQSDSLLITEFSEAWRWLMPTAFTLMDFTPIEMSKNQMLHLLNKDDRAHSQGPPDRLVNIYHSIDIEQLDTFAQHHEQLWLLQQGGGNSHRDLLQLWLKANYAHLRTIQWDDEDFPTTYSLSEYARAPENANLMLQADETFGLYAWSLKESIDVPPCQAITIESWWKTQQASQNPYTLTLILADDNGQVAISESVPADVFTTEWLTDAYYRDITTLTIPCDISAGSYNLLLGMKDNITGDSLALTYPDGNDIGTLFYLTTLNTQESE